MSAAPILLLERVTKSYRGNGREQTVLDGLSLDVRGGEMVAIVGPSGCGKTTLLNIIGALDRPDAGTVHCCGIDLTAADRATLTAYRGMLARVGLQDCAGKFPAQLSGGEQQRVAIARALGKQPALVLADEPTGNLDQDSGTQVTALLRALNAETRTTLVVVTHNPAVGSAADRTVRLEHGHVIEREPA